MLNLRCYRVKWYLHRINKSRNAIREIWKSHSHVWDLTTEVLTSRVVRFCESAKGNYTKHTCNIYRVQERRRCGTCINPIYPLSCRAHKSAILFNFQADLEQCLAESLYKPHKFLFWASIYLNSSRIRSSTYMGVTSNRIDIDGKKINVWKGFYNSRFNHTNKDKLSNAIIVVM